MTELMLESRSALPRPAALGAPRILFLLNGFPPFGGAEHAVACLIRGLRARGADVHLAGLLGPGPLPEIAELSPDRVATFDLRIGGYANLREIIRLYRYLRGMKFDVVHTHLDFANTVGVPLAKLAGAKVILPTAHSMYPERSRRRLWANRRLAQMATRWIAVSEAIAEHLATHEGMPAAKLVTVPNAVDMGRLPDPRQVDRAALRAELGLPSGHPLLAHVGSLRAEKRQEDLLRAFARVMEHHPSARLWIAGTGPLQADLENLTRELGLESRVDFLGYRADAARILAAADVSVLSSVREGLPVVVLESFAVGTPVVATRVGGVEGLLRGGRTGVLVPPQRAEELARAIVDLLNDHERQADLTTAAHAFVLERFSLDAVATSFLDLCRGLLEERRGRPVERTS